MRYLFEMLKAIRPLFVPLRKLKLSRAGFTLVELLVVIGIIAILAGVALGPITRAMKSAKQSAGMQTARTLALSEFQYANDNNSSYPDSGNTGADNGGVSASSVANCLINGGYISDPSIFFISGSTLESKYTGSMTLPVNIPATSISFDFCGSTNGNGVNPNTPDQIPLVWSSNLNVTSSLLQTASTGGGPVYVTVANTTPFATAGMAVCYKSNSASFVTATASGNNGSVALLTSGYPGWTAATVLPGGG
jgi:prepilin-type N-terminal cleavage/methylation domain-containing protein